MGDRSAAFAGWLYRHRGAVIALWGLLVAVSLAMLALHPARALETDLSGPPGTPADRVASVLRDDFGQKLGSSVDLVVTGPVDADDLVAAVRARVPQVADGREVVSAHAHALRLFHLQFGPTVPIAEAHRLTASLRAFAADYGRAHGDAITVTGSTAFQYDAKQASHRDGRRGESFSALVSLVVLLATFGAPLAALLPLLMGVTTLVEFNALAGALGVAANAISVVLTTLVGMTLAVDYALFLVSRFREELAAGTEPERALAVVIAHPGRTVAFSAAIMAVSLSALLVPNVSLCRTVIEELLGVVALSLVNALVFMPALLAWAPGLLLRPRGLVAWIARLRAERAWHALARQVAARPLAAFLLGVAAIATLAAPVTHMRLWEPVQAIAPRDSESMQAYERLRADGWGGELMPVQIVVEAPPGETVYEPGTIGYIDDLTRALEATPGVVSVGSLTSWKPGADKQAYQRFFGAMAHTGLLSTSSRLRQVVSPDARRTLVLVFPRDLMKLDDTDHILAAATSYAGKHPERAMWVGGVVARVRDFTVELYRHWPWLVAWVFAGIYALLVVYMRSVVLPLKAAVMNFLPILGAYGVLVMLFQDGLAASWLPLPVNGAVTNMVPILLFCVVFGLSMDYEVLMLARITEAYERDGDVRAAVVEGMGRSGAIITGAAAILLGVFATGIGSSSPQTQEICLGITVALAIDATIVRFLLVPGFMVLLGRWNWWRPFAKATPSEDRQAA